MLTRSLTVLALMWELLTVQPTNTEDVYTPAKQTMATAEVIAGNAV